MKPSKYKLSALLSVVTLLAACEPSNIASDTFGSALDGESGSSTHVFQLLSDDYTGGSLDSAKFSADGEFAVSKGTINDPTTFNQFTDYSVNWTSTIVQDSTLYLSLYDPANPDTTELLAWVDCEISEGTTCSLSQELTCFFIGYNDGSNTTAFDCVMVDDKVTNIEAGGTQQDMIEAFIPDWDGVLSTVDLTVGLQLSLCEVESEQEVCDIGTLGHVKIEEYQPASDE